MSRLKKTPQEYLRAEVIKSRKLRHLGRSYEHEALLKVKHKLDFIEQPYLDEIHSR